MKSNAEIKALITKDIPEEESACFALLYAMVMSAFSIVIKSGSRLGLLYETNRGVCASFAFKLIKKVFAFSPEIVKIKKTDFGNASFLYSLSVDESEVTMEMLHSFNMMDPSGFKGSEGIDMSLLSTQESKSAFVKGVFIACGYLHNPVKNYCIEFRFQNERNAVSFAEYLNSEFSINAKTRELGNAIIVYVKRQEDVSAVLTICGAYTAALEFEDRCAMAQMKNVTQRKVNCETANLNKTLDAAYNQVKAIEKIINSRGIASLSAPLQEAALLWIDNEEMSLKELSELSGISRSTLDKRLRKIIEIAEESYRK